MPCVKIQTNIIVPEEQREELISLVCTRISEKLGKPEKVTMVILEPAADIFFAGATAPAAFIELKSIGLTDEKTGELSDFLCTMIRELLGIEPERIYIEFSGVEGAMWGWNNRTFRKI